ncbi:MAG: COX15/CtaA family protein [Phycisphaerales bacterium]
MTSTQRLPINGSASPIKAGTFGPACSIGFASAVLMWVVAWILHLPGVQVATPVAIPLLLAPLFAMNLLWIPGVDRGARLKAAGLAGLIAGLVNLLILGSFITEQPESTAEMSEKANSLAPNAVVVVTGSIAVSVVVALIAGVLVKAKGASSVGGRRWLSRMAWVTALTYIPLIAVGGIVTSTDSGLAVPDAVTTYGAISVLFPLKLMAEPRIFFEHSHRLFGTLAGLTTIVLMIRVLTTRVQLTPKILSVLLFIAVSAQGILGIVRVADMSTAFAIIHGVFAQLVFALAFVIAVMLSLSWIEAQPSDEVRPLASKAKKVTLAAFLGLIIQLVFGALTRHMHSSHAMLSHMGFAFVVVALIMIAGALCIRAGKADATGRPIRIYGIVMHAIVTWQFALGFATLGLAWTSEKPDTPTSDTLHTAQAIDPVGSLVATMHHVSGAALLAVTACALAWGFRLARRPKMQ